MSGCPHAEWPARRPSKAAQKMTLLSVFVPSFNYERFIEDALDSIRAQGFEDLEVVIVDDCSNDQSIDVINRWIETRAPGFPVRLHVNEKNLGVAASTNIGMSLAKGRYFTNLDADDMLAPGVLTAHCELLEQNPHDGVAYGDVLDISHDGTEISAPHAAHPGYEGDLMLTLIEKGSVLPHIGSVIRTELLTKIGGISDDASYPDWPLWLALAQHTHFRYSGELAGYHRVHGNSISDTRSREMRLTRVQSLARLLREDSRKDVRRAAVRRTRRLSLEMWASQDGKPAEDALRGFVSERFDISIAVVSRFIGWSVPCRTLRRVIRRLNATWWP
jgi:glycosyltransferase involved in cell wall biosynthesis